MLRNAYRWAVQFASIGCLATAFAMPADAAPIAAGAIASGPVLTGAGTVVWAEYDRSIVAGLAPVGYVLRSAGPDGAAGFRVAGPAAAQAAVLPELHASQELVAVGHRIIELGGGGPFAAPSDTLTFSPSGAVLAHFGACAIGQVDALGLLALAGNDVASCDAGGRTVIIYDGRTGAVADQVVAADVVHGVRLAGRLVAWLEGSPNVHGQYTLVVFDREARREILRVATTTLGGLLYDWDLAADGRVAYSVGELRVSGTGLLRIGWTSPAEPVAHPLPVAARFGYGVRTLADGSVAFLREGADGAVEVGVVATDGTPARLLVTGDLTGFDVDASRLAYSLAGCEGSTIMVRSLRAPAINEPRRGRCPLRLARPVRRSADGTGLVIAPRCTALPFGCEGPVVLTTRARPGHAALVLARGSVGPSGRTTLRLRATARGLLRHHRTLTARLTIDFGRDPDRPDRRTAVVRLRGTGSSDCSQCGNAPSLIQDRSLLGALPALRARASAHRSGGGAG
jgi:hypothetical protein